MSRDYDEQSVDLVRRTLTAVAEATPVDPPRAGDLDELIDQMDRDRVIPLVRRPGAGRHRTPPRRRTVAVAAAVLAVVLAITAAWLAESDQGRDAPPADGTGDGALSERLEAGWLPAAVATGEPHRSATQGVGVDPDAAVFRPADGGDDGIVVAIADMSATTADTVAAAVERLVPADESGQSSSTSGVLGADGPGISIATWGPDVDAVSQVDSQVENGAHASEIALPGWTTTPLSVAWVPGIARSDTVRYGDPSSGPWVEVGTTVGELPDAGVLDALLPRSERIRVGDRTAWAFTSTPASAGGPERSGTWTILWQETDGLIGSVTSSGIAEDDVRRIAGDAELVDDPAPAELVRPEVVTDGEVGGATYTVEAWMDSWRELAAGPETVCWRLGVGGTRSTEEPNCQPANGMFERGGETGGHLVLGAVVSPDVTEVRVDEGTVERADVVSVGDGRAHLALIVATEEDAHNAMVSFVDAGGQASQSIEVLYE